MKFFSKLIRDEQGATAIESALIAVAAISALTSLGGSLSATFQKVNTDLSTANTAA